MFEGGESESRALTVRQVLTAEDRIKRRSYSEYVFFYGRKVNARALASTLFYIGRTVLFCLGLVLLQAKPYHGQVMLTLVPTIVLLAFASLNLHSLFLSDWIKVQFVVNEATIMFACAC